MPYCEEYNNTSESLQVLNNSQSILYHQSRHLQASKAKVAHTQLASFPSQAYTFPKRTERMESMSKVYRPRVRVSRSAEALHDPPWTSTQTLLVSAAINALAQLAMLQHRLHRPSLRFSLRHPI